VVVFEATGDGGVSVDDDSRPRASRTGSRRLRDISHLYISQRTPVVPVPASRRLLRVAITGGGLPAADCAASLATQWVRLGRRVLVVDLDPTLPNVGFRLGLAPAAYLRALVAAPPCVERGVCGVRVVTVPQADADAVAIVSGAMRDTDVVVLRLAAADPQTALAPYAESLAAPAPVTTMERAATRSPMFEAWMATARRPPRREPAASPAARLDRNQPLTALLDVVVPVGDAGVASGYAGVPVRPLGWGDATPAAGWARVPAHAPPAHLPLAVLEPEHPVGRVFESLAQALLAGLGRRREGDAHA